MSLFILGPLTRLADAILKHDELRKPDTVLIARNATERTAISARYPDVTTEVIGAITNPPLNLAKVRILVCALGPLHPGVPLAHSDAERTIRDLNALDGLLAMSGSRSVHVVFISSVLALSPRRSRFYYAGWKCVVQGALEQSCSIYPNCHLSILYPGRLISADLARRPRALIHTTYSKLAQIILRVAKGDDAIRKVVGLDARLWLARRSIHLLSHIVDS